MSYNRSGWVSATVQCSVTHKPETVWLFAGKQDGKLVVLLSNGCDNASGSDLCKKCIAREKFILQKHFDESGKNPFEPDVFYP